MPRQKVPDAIRELKEQVKFLKRQIPKKPHGRPTLFDDKQIAMLERAVQFQMREDQTAWLLGVSKSALEKFIKRHYGMSFSEFRDSQTPHFIFAILNKAMKKGLVDEYWPAIQKLAEQYCGWGSELKISGDGNPFQLVINAPKQD